MKNDVSSDAELKEAEQDAEQVEDRREQEAEAAQEPEQETDLRQQLDEMKKEMDRMRDRYLRLAADFDNYRRRTRQEMEEVRRTAAERLLRELLPLADNFERAIAAVRSELSDKVITGIDMIYRQLLNILGQAGVEPMEAVGKPFDPAYHEAFEEVVTGEWPEGTVASEIQKGYLLGGKVLRPALVRVAKGPEIKDQAEAECLDKEDGSNE
ncbi:MAG TPA: nucleotide exchange factor GrpE [Syntrophomonadaceae bacterium]|nr:nucleotide exchange factor GrpE [Syntrophomonadaceae bacterium]